MHWLTSALALTALAPCRFTVRDVAFVDLRDEPYRLAIRAPATDEERLRNLASAVLANTNIEVEVAGTSVTGASIAGASVTEAVLKGPGGRAARFSITDQRGGPTALLDAIASSPARELLARELIERYCVVVLVESGSRELDRTARAAIDAAFVRLRGIFDRMPKDVGTPPRLLRVAANQRQQERWLLWGLGVDDSPAEPVAAVLFGRGRRVGPRLDGTAITSDAVFQTLANVGQSCECELDRSWMRGPRIPMRWSESTRALAAQTLGFDPDSPLVRTEISAILARGSRPRRERGSTTEDMLADYSEEAVDGPSTESPGAEDKKTPTGNAVMALLAVLVVSLLAGATIVSRSRE